jgi:hypothetical protein
VADICPLERIGDRRQQQVGVEVVPAATGAIQMLLQHDLAETCPLERPGDRRQQQIGVEVVPAVTRAIQMVLQWLL